MWILCSVERKQCTPHLHTYTTINEGTVVCRKAKVYSPLIYLHYNKCGHCILYKWNGVQHSYIPTLQKNMCIVVCTKETVQTTPTSLHYNKCRHCGLYRGNCVQHSYTPTLQQMWSLWSVESKWSAALLHTYTITNVVILICGKETVCSTPTYLHCKKNVHRGLNIGNSADHSYIPTLQ